MQSISMIKICIIEIYFLKIYQMLKIIPQILCILAFSPIRQNQRCIMTFISGNLIEIKYIIRSFIIKLDSTTNCITYTIMKIIFIIARLMYSLNTIKLSMTISTCEKFDTIIIKNTKISFIKILKYFTLESKFDKVNIKRIKIPFVEILKYFTTESNIFFLNSFIKIYFINSLMKINSINSLPMLISYEYKRYLKYFLRPKKCFASKSVCQHNLSIICTQKSLIKYLQSKFRNVKFYCIGMLNEYNLFSYLTFQFFLSLDTLTFQFISFLIFTQTTYFYLHLFIFCHG